MNIEWTFEPGRVFSIDEQDELIAEATFCEKADGVLDIDHTYVISRLRGQGIAGQLMTAAAEHIRERKGKVTASCSYANAWFKRHQKDYADIISDDLAGEAPACRLDGRK